jgi:PadR family transcriptional regulator, regulatory protein AphA
MSDMNIKTVCLALLAHGEASGYDLKRRWTEGPFAHFVDASLASIYPALNKLEAEGLVSFREEVQSGKPSRKMYELTDAGKAAFVEALSAPPLPDAYRSPFALIALCAPFLPRNTVAAALDERLGQQKAQLADLKDVRTRCEYGPIEWLLDWGIHCFSREIEYLEASRHRLEDLAASGEPGRNIDVCPPRSAAGKG